jgi:hypothetical protein
MGNTGVRLSFFNNDSTLADRLLVGLVFALAFLATFSVMLPGTGFGAKYQMALYVFAIAEVLIETGHRLSLRLQADRR